MRWPGDVGKAQPRYGGLTVSEEDCSYVWNIAVQDRCEWIKRTEDCKIDAIFPYANLLFCNFGTENMAIFAAGFLLLMLWLLYLFLILGTTADNFFCPSLSVIASVLRLSENIAGVTILAFGNGSPDIFTSLVASEDERLIMFTELIGAGVFVTAIIAGTVIVSAPFRVYAKFFLRDVLFYIIAACWISYIAHDELIHVLEAAGCILIYIMFIIVVVIMQRIESKHDRSRKRMPAVQDAEVLQAFVENRQGDVSAPPRLPKRSRPFDVHAKLDVAIVREEARLKTRSINSDNAQSTSLKSSPKRPKGIFSEFLYDVNPINKAEWQESQLSVKMLLILRAPFMILLQLFIPVVNETSEKRGWSKLLNCFQLCVTLILALFILQLWTIQVGPVPLWAVFLCCTSVISLIVLLLTSADKVPKYHNALAFFGFLGAMLVVYAVAQEVMAVLEVVGFASGISPAMLGITLLAWGNSVGDLISNVAIARRGFPRMGFSACFGGPMFNTLLGLGLTFGAAAGRSPGLQVRIRTSDMAPGCLAFLLCTLLASLLYLCATGFVARKSYGYMLYTVYGIFMLINVLSEVHFIHPLGTDHRPDGVL